MYGKLILVRHGQSTYNEENRFTGWKDVDLTDKGANEAVSSSSLLEGISIDLAFTSNLMRAQKTLDLILKGLNVELNITKNEALNERDYGSLVGQNKFEAAQKYGEEQVQIWRRSYDIPPPDGESLKMTLERTVPYFKNTILPLLAENNNIIISAHGNSIRSIVMYLLSISEEDILKTEIGWCEPWVFDLNENQEVISLDIMHSSSESDSHLPEKYVIK
ncbi:2,3-diphosphoglycerate-dependent phosphoglycerate mutase [bacterium]|nr:2,3-diphosphoglycerate-dependent phosphoglycerate mutase [bacterium]